MISETAVILGSLANGTVLTLRLLIAPVGSLTLRALLTNSAPAHLLNSIKSLTSDSVTSSHISQLIPPLLRALRNLLVSTADLAWGHIWGVGAERKVVSTGLVGEETSSPTETKGKRLPQVKGWKAETRQALSLIFEVGGDFHSS